MAVRIHAASAVILFARRKAWLIMENGPEPILVPPAGNKPRGMGILFQIIALVFAFPAVVWGVVVVWSTAFPPICGDSSGVVAMGVAECWIVDLPIGLLALAIGLFVKSGSARLRKICIGTSLIILSLPIIASSIFQIWHCH
ncbi:MAG: hypothetical protein ACLPKT_11800 [Methylocella sp.]